MPTVSALLAYAVPLATLAELLPATSVQQVFALTLLVTAIFLGAREGRVRSLKSQVDDLEAVVEIRRLRAEEESNKQAARIAQLAAELKTERDVAEQARRDLVALSRVVTGEAHYVALVDVIDTHREELVAHRRDLLERFDQILDRLERLDP